MKNTVFPILTENEQKLPYYVFSIGLDHVQEHILRTSGYPCYQWIQCRSGAGRLVVAGNEYQICKDQGVLLMPDEVHEYYAESSEDWVVDWIGLTGSGIAEFFANTAKLTTFRRVHRFAARRSARCHGADPGSRTVAQSDQGYGCFRAYLTTS